MSNEIRYSIRATVQNGQFSEQQNHNISEGQTNEGAVGTVQVLTETPTTVDLGSTATPGRAFFKNLDAVNAIQIGIKVSGTFYPFTELLPGEVDTVRLIAGTTYWAQGVLLTGTGTTTPVSLYTRCYLA
jgi:hypothetical protein